MRKIISVVLAALLCGNIVSRSQTFTASLTGSPVNTTGWLYGGSTAIAGTDINLTPATTNQYGYIYYSTAVNLTCGSFTATFDFKTSNHSPGSPADGIAFFYSTTAPGSFTSGGAIGLPNSMTGFAMVFDTYDNDANGNNPLVSLRNFNGTNTVTYTEGSTYGAIGQPDLTRQSFITDGNWHTCQLSYTGGVITVAFDGNPPAITFPYALSINGYFGFTAATGASYSLQSIRNVSINAWTQTQPAVANCDLDKGQVQFTGARTTATYNWYSGSGTLLGTGPSITVPIGFVPSWVFAVLTNPIPGCKDTLRSDTFANFFASVNPDVICTQFGTPVQLTTTVTGGVPNTAYTYTWAGPQTGQLSCTNCANPVATPSSATSLFLTVTDRIGCMRKDTVIFGQGPNAGPDLKVCPLGERPAQLHVVGPPNASFHWYEYGTTNPGKYLSCTDCTDPVSAPETASYTYTVGYDGCPTLDTIVVYHDTTNYIVAPQDLIVQCRPDYRILLSQAYGPNPKANVSCGIANPITCTVPDTAVIGIPGVPPQDVSNTPFLTANNFIKYQFIIKKQDILYNGLYSGTINALAFKTLKTTISSTSPVDYLYLSLGCIDQTDFPTPTSNNSFYGTTFLTQVAMKSGYTLTPDAWNDITFDAPYSWDTSKNLLVDICVGPLAAPDATNGFDQVSMEEGVAIQKFSNSINVCGGNAPTAYRYTQRPTVRLTYCETPDLPFQYTWVPGNNLNDSTIQNPTAYIPRSQNYAVYSVGRNGCKLRDSLHIFVPEHKLSVGPADSFICKGQPAFLYASGGQGYKWFEVHGGVFSDASGSLSCTDCAAPVATPGATTQYAVVYSNEVGMGNPNNPEYITGCPDTLMITVNVWPLPDVSVLNADTTITIGQSVPLYVRGAQHYTWSPSGSLTDPNAPMTMAHPTTTTTYVATGYDMNGCAYTDTVKVTVNYHTNLLVPSAFTPNGDGRNDVFRIVNGNVQRLMEFRVFNRWGQEIFSTTDINAGWDGTWKGVKQEVGTYQYLIRVGYADQQVETYKGDVSLIR